MAKLVLTTIAGASIEVGPITFNLYAKGSDGRMVLFCKANFPITPRHKKILNRTDRVFYINSDQVDLYLEYSYERIEQIVSSKDIRIGDKSRIVRGIGKMVMRKLIDEPRSGALVDKSRRFVDSQIELILNSPEAKPHLFALSATDPYFLSHSVNVSIFCVLLGEELFGNSRNELRQLGIGGLLHDIGKTQIDKTLILKPTPLTDKEWEEMRKHPIFSYNMITNYGLSDGVVAMGRSHHEKINGGGYPDGLSEDQIHPFARIAAVANVYDNLTSERFSRSKLTHMQALSKMVDDSGRYDPDVFNALLKIVVHDSRLISEFMKKQAEGHGSDTSATRKKQK